MYAKLISNFLVYAPNPILHNGLWYGNPPGEIYVSEGYKPVHFTEPPGQPDVGYKWAEKWVETETDILQGWEQVLVPITDEEALVRYTNEVTGADDETLLDATETLLKIGKVVK